MSEGSALKAMVAFFTVWKQDITAEDMEAMDRKFHLLPVVGALLGLLVLIETLVMCKLAQSGLPLSGMFIAAVVLFTVYAGSRFLHFDGLADFGDGSIVAGTREDHVRALKDTLLGAGGLGVALLVTLTNFSIYSMLGVFVMIAAPVTEIMVKNAQVACAAFGHPGGGMAGRQVSETCPRSLCYSIAISFVLSAVLGLAAYAAADVFLGLRLDILARVIGAVIAGLAVSSVAGYAMARRADSVFGMVNGDILGATNEISRIFAGIAMFAVLAW